MKSRSSIVLNSIQDKIDEIQQKIQTHKAHVLFIQQTKDRIEILNHEKQKQIFRIDNIIHETIKEHGFNSIKDLGKLLGFLKSKYPGQLDMQTVAEKAKTIFND